jgi:hypothetical protein
MAGADSEGGADAARHSSIRASTAVLAAGILGPYSHWGAWLPSGLRCCFRPSARCSTGQRRRVAKGQFVPSPGAANWPTRCRPGGEPPSRGSSAGARSSGICLTMKSPQLRSHSGVPCAALCRRRSHPLSRSSTWLRTGATRLGKLRGTDVTRGKPGPVRYAMAPVPADRISPRRRCFRRLPKGQDTNAGLVSIHPRRSVLLPFGGDEHPGKEKRRKRFSTRGTSAVELSSRNSRRRQRPYAGLRTITPTPLADVPNSSLCAVTVASLFTRRTRQRRLSGPLPTLKWCIASPTP